VLTKIVIVAIWHVMTPEQSRAARGWLDLSQSDLAALANVSLSTVRDFEKRRRNPIGNNKNAMKEALEGKGIAFTESGLTGPAI
jgi:DNA-binding transcriptional regulator YiaG